MADTYQQPRKSKNSDDDTQIVLDKKFAYGMGLGSASFVGGTAVTSPEVLGFICGIEQMAAMETPEDNENWTSRNSAYNMAVDMSTDSTANIQGFREVNAFETANALNEMFEPKE